MAQLMCTTTMVNNVVVAHDIVYNKATRIASHLNVSIMSDVAASSLDNDDNISFLKHLSEIRVYHHEQHPLS